MTNNQLIENKKDNFFMKIKKFFKNMFNKKETTTQITPNNQTIQDNEAEKKKFMKVYNMAKRGDIDVLMLTPEILEKINALMEEEIMLKEKELNEMKAKLNVY